MSEQEKPGDGTPSKDSPEDRLKNLSSEFNRKIENLDSKVTKTMTEATQALLDKIEAMRTGPGRSEGKSSDSQEDLGSMMYSDPNKFVEKIIDLASGKATKNVETVLVDSNKAQQVYSEIVRDFPETANDKSPLTLRAKEILTTYGNQAHKDPTLLKSAVFEAAAELGIRKSSFRQDSGQDSFSLGDQGGSTQRKPSGSEELSSEVEEMAKAFGVDVNPQSKARMKKFQDHYANPKKRFQYKEIK